MDKLINSIGIIIYTTLLYTPPLLFAALGSCFSENSGVVNIGIEGMMTIGAFVGATVGHFTGMPWISFFCGGLAGALFGMLHAVATVKLNADQTIPGTAINFLAPGISILLALAIAGALAGNGGAMQLLGQGGRISLFTSQEGFRLQALTVALSDASNTSGVLI